MSPAVLPDSEHRARALDTGASFIVQAPAGSGKTELLILRFLKLLCLCEQPEQVLAITFTKKAANEMSRRIVNALRWADGIDSGDPLPTEPLLLQRLEVARQVLAQDKARDWHLLEYPSRLRVQTIDSFCFYLAGQLPILSQLGGNPKVSDDVSACFIDAIANTLAMLETESSLSADLAHLLTHLDNDVAKVETLLVGLLYKRDQWLPHLLLVRSQPEASEQLLQEGLDELIGESLEQVRAGLAPYEDELLPLVNFAAENLEAAGKLAEGAYTPHIALPDTTPDTLSDWQFIVNSLLTKEGGLRKTVDVRCGFPAADKTDKDKTAVNKARKTAMLALLETLAIDTELAIHLAYLRLLPDPALETNAWPFLGALTRVLIQLSTELLLSFRRFRVIDYTQASAAARTALGSEENPTDLALMLDHRIQHVLVDEFQDTSQLQLDILQQITAGWVEGDGRTLFLVGDAMQSCYGFRNANVGIYLNVRARGLGDIALTPLTLETNFRSQERVVAWVNTVFGAAFPAAADISRGAVPYTHSVALHPALPQPGVRAELIGHDGDTREQAQQLEAERVVAQILTLQRNSPGESIAILVRARTHLTAIVPALRAAGISWQATDIDRLATLPVIEDLISLTRALLNQADRLSWLAVLRATWCGLTLADLHAIARAADTGSIWGTLANTAPIAGLSTDGAERLSGIKPVLEFGMRQRLRGGLRQSVEHCWRLLGGIHTVANSVELDSVAQFLSLLSEHENAGGLADIDSFCALVAAAFVPGRVDTEVPEPPPIHLLTMHKAKGLEFDHVLLPGLARRARSDEKPLLQWHARLNQAGVPRLFLATLSAAGKDDDPLYRLLRHEQKEKILLESTRLLYIAVTRARTSATLFATLTEDDAGGLKAPEQSSLLRRIWEQLDPASADVQVLSAVTADAAPAAMTYPPRTPIRRFTAPHCLKADASARLKALLTALDQAPETEHEAPASEPEASIGTLIHRSLEVLTVTGATEIAPARLPSLRAYWRLQLRDVIVGENALDAGVAFVEHAVMTTLGNSATRWLFDPALDIKESELALSRRAGDKTFNYKIDRSCVDASGVRWIVDYKTALPVEGEDEQTFIDRECQRYTKQLATYRALLADVESRPIRTALFFTGLGRLVDVPTS